jgi:glycopeptide antibiotics resistance protein
MMIDFSERDLLIGIGMLCLILPVLWWRKRSLSYLLFFSIFWVYILAVVRAVIFPIVISNDLIDSEFSVSMNLRPFYFSDCSMFNLCVKDVVDNILLTIPFGFGINFLIRIKPKNILWLSLMVGIVFEFSQLVISLTFRSGFRAIDINDVIFNGIGVLIGYGLFRLFAWAYVRVAKYINLKYMVILSDVYEIALQAQTTDG